MPYKDIIAVGAQGYGTQSHGAVPAGIFPYNPRRSAVQQDLDKAKALLAQAGHKGGGFTLEPDLRRRRTRARRGSRR